MGKSAAEIESDLERQRRALSGRIARLEGRLRGDANTVVDAALDDTRRFSGATLGTSVGSETVVAEHPAALLSGAFAGGALLGFATGGTVQENDAHSRRSTAAEEEAGSGPSMLPLPAIRPLGRIGASIVDPLRAAMTAKLADFTQDVFSDLFGKAKDAIERPHPPRNGQSPELGVLGSAWDNLPEHTPPHPAGAGWAPEEAEVH